MGVPGAVAAADVLQLARELSEGAAAHGDNSSSSKAMSAAVSVMLSSSVSHTELSAQSV